VLRSNYAGTSFASLDKWQSGNFSTVLTSLIICWQNSGTTHWVMWRMTMKGWKPNNGIWLKMHFGVNYPATRDQVHMIGQNDISRWQYSAKLAWRASFQRMSPNVSLKPNEKDIPPDDVIKECRKRYLHCGSWPFSTDQPALIDFPIWWTISFYEIRR